MKMHEFLEATKEFNEQLDVPFKVWTSLGGKGFPHIWGDTISFTQEGDFLTLQEAREVITWLADQLGGEVTWNKG